MSDSDDSCNHYWADISTHEDDGKRQVWLCTHCGERSEVLEGGEG